MQKPQRLIPIALLMGLLTGCGGGSPAGNPAGAGAPQSNAMGQAVIHITWPQTSAGRASRLIPGAAASVRVTFFSDQAMTHQVATTLVPKPSQGFQSSVAVDNLPVGTLFVGGTAYPNPDGTGT